MRTGNFLNKSFGALLILILVISCSSCNKQLNLSPEDSFDSKTFWNSESNATLALTALYRGHIQINAPNANLKDWWSYPSIIFLDLASDNGYDRRGENSPINKLSNGTLTSTDPELQNAWDMSYYRIERCNDFLEHMGKVPMNDSTKKRFIAEARFIRACQYFYLSQYWGSVPLVTTTLTPEEANTVKKASKADVERFTETEFLAAAKDLPHYNEMPVSEFGRASSQASLAFLGRLYMSEEKWSDAAATYQQIIDWGDNSIDPNYSSLFDGTNEHSKEIIFSVQFVENLQGNGMLQHLMPVVAGGWSFVNPLGSLVEAYDFKDGTPFSYSDPRYDPNDLGADRDPRLGYTILYNGSKLGSLPYISHPDSTTSDRVGGYKGQLGTLTGYSIRKYCPDNFSGDLKSSGLDVPIIRYAEILLSDMEARIEAGDAIDQNILDATINKVRGRTSVNMPPVTETDPAKLLKIVSHERRIELAFEGVHYWDLLRWHTAGSVLQGQFYGEPYLGAKNLRKAPDGHKDPYSRWYVTTKHFREQDYQWPVPQSEVNINPSLQ